MDPLTLTALATAAQLIYGAATAPTRVEDATRGPASAEAQARANISTAAQTPVKAPETSASPRAEATPPNPCGPDADVIHGLVDVRDGSTGHTCYCSPVYSWTNGSLSRYEVTCY